MDFSSAAAPKPISDQPGFLFLISSALKKHVWFGIFHGFISKSLGQCKPKSGPLQPHSETAVEKDLIFTVGKLRELILAM